MMLKRMGLAAALIGAGLGIAGCTDGYGYGYGGGVSLGYGSGYYDDYGYADPYLGYGYPSYFGWYGNYYYPGTGVYVYDRYRRPYRWDGDQRRYWEGRRGSYRGAPHGFQDNWNGFTRRHDGNGYQGQGGQGFNGHYRGNYGGHWRGGATPQAGQPQPSAPGAGASSGATGAHNGSWGGDRGNWGGGRGNWGGNRGGGRGRH